jgi:hypothetical protein
MSASWIKIEHGLIDKPEVMELCDMLDSNPHEVVGHLVAFWFWVDSNLSRECPRVKGTLKGVDRVSGRDGFGNALVSVGWLLFENGMISIPNYDNHLSKSAKQRAIEQRKKAKQRGNNCPVSVPASSGQIGGPEKRREEKINKKSKKESSEHPGFPSWYEIYPVKKARGQASVAYAKAIKHLEATHGQEACSFLENRTRALVPDLLAKAPYIKHPATWLNAQGWDDEPTPTAAASKVLTPEELDAWRPS